MIWSAGGSGHRPLERTLGKRGGGDPSASANTAKCVTSDMYGTGFEDFPGFQPRAADWQPTYAWSPSASASEWRGGDRRSVRSISSHSSAVTSSPPSSPLAQWADETQLGRHERRRQLHSSSSVGELPRRGHPPWRWDTVSGAPLLPFTESRHSRSRKVLARNLPATSSTAYGGFYQAWAPPSRCESASCTYRMY